jgi:hypothetical protein
MRGRLAPAQAIAPFPIAAEFTNMQEALVQHIRSRIFADVDFLASQSLLSQSDAETIKSKLPVSLSSSSGSALQLGSQMHQMTLSNERLAHDSPHYGGPKQQARAVWDYHQSQVSPCIRSYRSDSLQHSCRMACTCGITFRSPY